ncbi:MAG: polysaccharide deacetylase family protein [Pseudomonadota bacterium]
MLSEPDPLFPDEPDVGRFSAICKLLKDCCNVLPLADAVEQLRNGSLPSRAACITFDDGYADNCTQALPVLQAHGLPATFFIATGFLNGGRMWNDTLIEAIRSAKRKTIDLDALGLGVLRIGTVNEKRQALQKVIPHLKHKAPVDRDRAVAMVVSECDPASLPDDLMMTNSQLLAMRDGGMTIGAHTENHPILASCDRSHAHEEIARGRETLEALLGQRVSMFAYPNGKIDTDYTGEHVDIVRELGFDAAVTTNAGASDSSADRFQLHRFTPWDRQPWRFGLRLAQNLARR